jgi:uncharacterized protein YndB with AHSA1/START domain
MTMRLNEVSIEIDIAAPPELVWKLIMDPDRLSEWVTIHRRLGKVSDRPLELGSTVEQGLSLRGAHFTVRWRLTEVEEPRLVRWEGRGPAGSRADSSYRLKAADGGTRFFYRNEFHAPFGPFGAAASRALMGDIPEREAKATLLKLKHLLERDGDS